MSVSPLAMIELSDHCQLSNRNMGVNYDNYNSCSGTFVWSETYKEQDIKQLLATEKTQGN